MALTHKEKVRLARQNQTIEEKRERGKGMFQTAFWESHRLYVAAQVARREARQQPKL